MYSHCSVLEYIWYLLWSTYVAVLSLSSQSIISQTFFNCGLLLNFFFFLRGEPSEFGIFGECGSVVLLVVPLVSRCGPPVYTIFTCDPLEYTRCPQRDRGTHAEKPWSWAGFLKLLPITVSHSHLKIFTWSRVYKNKYVHQIFTNNKS